MRKLIAIIITVAGCKSPPPITDGKCRIMSYSGRDPDERQCVYERTFDDRRPLGDSRDQIRAFVEKHLPGTALPVKQIGVLEPVGYRCPTDGHEVPKEHVCRSPLGSMHTCTSDLSDEDKAFRERLREKGPKTP